MHMETAIEASRFVEAVKLEVLREVRAILTRTVDLGGKTPPYTVEGTLADAREAVDERVRELEKTLK